MGERERRASQIGEMAREAYAKHDVLTEEGPGMWTIRRKDSGNFLTRIVAIYPHLICVGDGPTAVFYGGDPGEPLGMVRWVADGSDSYMTEKLYIGIGGRGGEWSARLDQACMVEDIQDYICRCEDDDPDLEHFNWALHQARDNEDLQGARDTIFCNVTDGFDYSPGEVTSERVYYAREACRALLRLIDAKAGA